jgi:hypothetical protein
LGFINPPSDVHTFFSGDKYTVRGSAPVASRLCGYEPLFSLRRFREFVDSK